MSAQLEEGAKPTLEERVVELERQVRMLVIFLVGMFLVAMISIAIVDAKSAHAQDSGGGPMICWWGNAQHTTEHCEQRAAFAGCAP